MNPGFSRVVGEGWVSQWLYCPQTTWNLAILEYSFAPCSELHLSWLPFLAMVTQGNKMEENGKGS